MVLTLKGDGENNPLWRSGMGLKMTASALAALAVRKNAQSGKRDCAAGAATGRLWIVITIHQHDELKNHGGVVRYGSNHQYPLATL